MRHKWALAALLIFASYAGVGAADNPADAVRAVEMRRLAAMVDVDSVVLEQVLSDDLVYAHSNGIVQSKSELIGALISGRFDYREVTTHGLAVRVYGNAAVITGAADIEVGVGEKTIRASLLFTDIYIRQGGVWRMVSYQSTPAPASPNE